MKRKLSDRRKIQIFIILPAFLITLAYTLLTKVFYLKDMDDVITFEPECYSIDLYDQSLNLNGSVSPLNFYSKFQDKKFRKADNNKVKDDTPRFVYDFYKDDKDYYKVAVYENKRIIQIMDMQTLDSNKIIKSYEYEIN